jgi:thiol-disulfide isomerase/thioredoxin
MAPSRNVATGFAEMLRGIDAFHLVPRDLADDKGADWTGRFIFTALGWAVIALLSVTEIMTFSTVTWTTSTEVSRDMDSAISIEFNITMPAVPCRYIKIGSKVNSFDLAGKFGIDDTILLQPLRPDGRVNPESAGAFISKEIIPLWSAHDFLQLKDEEVQPKLLSAPDASSSDVFVSTNFSDVVKLHDFTLVYFFADWCKHSAQFHPTWGQLVDSVDEKMQFPDQAGRNPSTVKLLRVHCADFRDMCKDLEIVRFPTFRLYRRDGTYVTFDKYSAGSIVDFLQAVIRGDRQKEPSGPGGCAVTGHLNLPRVAGSFHLTVGPSKDSTPNPDLINISHVVNHLAFGDSDANYFHAIRVQSLMKIGVPASILDHLTPLDGKEFVVKDTYDVPEHTLKVVSTKIGAKKDFYQITHADRTVTPTDKQRNSGMPHVRFAYDFSPLRVVLEKKSMPWYDFMTSLTAILGGTYAVLRCCGGALDNIYLVGKSPAKRM